MCDIETGEPFAHLDSPYNWVGEKLSIDEITLEWSNKRSKHLVAGDEVRFGRLKSFNGTIESIEKAIGGDEWEDIFHLIDCYDTLEKDENLKDMAQSIERTQPVERKDCSHKSYLSAKIENDNVNWKKIEKEWIDFTDEHAPGNDEILKWWKEKTDPK